MRSSVRRVITGAITLAIATAMATAGSASADEPPGGIVWDHVYTNDPGIDLYVEEHGDVISICDAKEDGGSPVLAVLPNIGSPYSLYVTGGVGSCLTAKASDGGAHDLAEGATVGLNYTNKGVGSQHAVTFVNDH